MELNKVGELDIRTITDFEGINQRKKSFLEKVIKDILLKNKNTIKFGDDRTIVKLGDKTLTNTDDSHKETIFTYNGNYCARDNAKNKERKFRKS